MLPIWRFKHWNRIVLQTIYTVLNKQHTQDCVANSCSSDTKYFLFKAAQHCTYENLSSRKGGERKRGREMKMRNTFSIPLEGRGRGTERERENYTQSRGFTIIQLLKNLWNWKRLLIKVIISINEPRLNYSNMSKMH